MQPTGTAGMPLDEDALTTPSRALKRLFVPCSSSKRSLFREERDARREADGGAGAGTTSDAESDLGPMSPLALTDHSSCDSSPGRQFVSPLATPERSPVIPLTNWSRLVPRASPGKFNRVLFGSPASKQRALAELASPEKRGKGSVCDEEVLPETPGKESDFDDQQSYVAETPQKEECAENRLITPLGSVCKNIPIPRIHRRKSLGALDNIQCTSPEIQKSTLKRHLEDSSSCSNAKYQKTDELCLSVPKARAALFQDRDKHENEKNKAFTLAPNLFYGSNGKKSRKSATMAWREPEREVKRRRSMPACSSSNRRSSKKHRVGEINCGVWHGIKKPKPKRQVLQHNLVKSDKQNENNRNKVKDSKENSIPQNKISENNKNEKVEEIDPNKKIFKTKAGNNAIVTINDKIKLRVALNQKDSEHVSKKAKLDQMSFDTADLSVDEPAIEKSLEPSKVNNILKILEDDWADDDDENSAMEISQTIYEKNMSPKKSNIQLKNLTMSPASELSNMASTMNIDEDISESSKTEDNENSKNLNNTTQKFYPLFSKGYLPKTLLEESNSRKRKRNSWQLSTKYGNSENQYQLDAGQKMFGATQCTECGIVYQIGEPDDENAHLNYHNSFKSLKFQGWKNERVVFKDAYTCSRIILIEPKDSTLYWKKVTEILEIVDRDLGLSDMKISYYRDKRIYMYVKDKTILGILVAEYVKNAYRMIPDLGELNCCTTETTPVKCGVNVVWTAMSHRRQGIATKLVDTLRTTFFYGYILSIEDIAFSTPTPSGKQFAEKYTKCQNFKVYYI